MEETRTDYKKFAWVPIVIAILNILSFFITIFVGFLTQIDFDLYYVFNLIRLYFFVALYVAAFGLLAWVFRSNKRLFIPLLVYAAAKFLSIFLQYPLSIHLSTATGGTYYMSIFPYILTGIQLAFFSAFFGHPMNLLKVGSILSFVGGVLSLIMQLYSDLIRVFSQSYVQSYVIYSVINLLLSILFLAFQAIFWIALSMAMSSPNPAYNSLSRN